jgi:hypothetical protein
VEIVTVVVMTTCINEKIYRYYLIINCLASDSIAKPCGSVLKSNVMVTFQNVSFFCHFLKRNSLFYELSTGHSSIIYKEFAEKS